MRQAGSALLKVQQLAENTPTPLAPQQTPFAEIPVAPPPVAATPTMVHRIIVEVKGSPYRVTVTANTTTVRCSALKTVGISPAHAPRPQ